MGTPDDRRGPMTARDLILARIRRSLGVSGADPDRRAVVAERISSSPRGVIPARGHVPPEQRADLFMSMAIFAHATAQRLARHRVPAAIAELLRQHDAPAIVHMGTDPRLASLDWSGADIQAVVGHATPDDRVGVSYAEAGIAETGTAVIVAGPANPSLFAYLPPVHIVIVDADDIVPDAESAFELLRSRFRSKQPGRTVNFITGPSRSGDIELTMQLGAHGPAALHLLVVEGEAVHPAEPLRT